MTGNEPSPPGVESSDAPAPHGRLTISNGHSASAASRSADATLATLADSIRTCAKNIASAFAEVSSNANGDTTQTFASIIQSNRTSTSGDLRIQADTVLSEMFVEARAVATVLRETVAQLEDVIQGIYRLVRLVEGLRRISKVSSFLATQAAVEGAHIEGAQGAEFSITGQRIRQLVDTSKALYTDIETLAIRIGRSAHMLVLDVRRVLAEIEQNDQHGKKLQSAVGAALTEYEKLTTGRLGTLDAISKQTVTDVHALFRGLQFEDMTVQLVAGIRRRIQSGDTSDAGNGPVIQESMTVGEVELF